MIPERSTQIARALLQIGAVRFEPDSPIRFKSGILSPVYVDNRRLPFFPAEWRTIIQGFQALIQAEGLVGDVVAGVAVGGVPHSAALAYTLGWPSVFVRKEAKTHGTGRSVEGGDVSGRHVLLVEDLVTTGSSSLHAVAMLREEGARVEDVLAIVSYGFSEAETAFEAARIRLHTLTDFGAILAEAARFSRVTPDRVEMIADWLDDPHGWAGRRGLA